MAEGNTRSIVVEMFPPKGTTNDTIAQDMRASIAARRGVSFDGTVGGFIDALPQLGIQREMPLAMIEYGVSQYGNGTLIVDTEDGGIAIREGR